MANRKGPEPDKEMKAPMWVVTFGDLISLLVTFFVLIFTFSAMDQDKYRRVSGSLSGALGAMTPDQKKSKENIVKPEVPETAETALKGSQNIPRRHELESTLDDRIQDPNVFDKKVDLDRIPDGIRIRLDSDYFFEPGRTTISAKSKDVLVEIARFFRAEPVRIVVEAHTDPVTAQVGSGDPVEQTRLVAREMARVFVEDGGWEARRIGASGRGAAVPLNDNRTATDRQRNRRVEVLVIWDPTLRGRL